MAKEKKGAEEAPLIDGAAVMSDGRLAALRNTGVKDLMKNANAAKKYLKGKK